MSVAADCAHHTVETRRLQVFPGKEEVKLAGVPPGPTDILVGVELQQKNVVILLVEALFHQVPELHRVGPSQKVVPIVEAVKVAVVLRNLLVDGAGFVEIARVVAGVGRELKSRFVQNSRAEGCRSPLSWLVEV